MTSCPCCPTLHWCELAGTTDMSRELLTLSFCHRLGVRHACPGGPQPSGDGHKGHQSHGRMIARPGSGLGWLTRPKAQEVAFFGGKGRASSADAEAAVRMSKGRKSSMKRGAMSGRRGSYETEQTSKVMAELGFCVNHGTKPGPAPLHPASVQRANRARVVPTPSR